MTTEITVSAGQKAKIKTGTFSSVGFVYCGMPNPDVFSISYMESSGYQGYAMNVFYPKKIKNIVIGKKNFMVIRVTPESIALSPMM
ncbi:MAG: hypothetical protein JW716_02440 [Candidatus Aenigmarchaeota archaeon]|nr:hypothetical protein [Candidatus Aenigmarchaeota archaeon]